MLYGVLLSVLAAFCWGSTTLLMRGMKHLGPLDMTLGRAAGALAASLLIAFFAGGVAPLAAFSCRDIAALVVLVLSNNVFGDIALFLALHTLGVAYGSSISSTYPLVVAVMAILFYGEPFTFHVVAGTLLVVAGIAALCQRGGEQRVSARGLTLAMLASLLWGVGLSMNKPLVMEGFSPQSILMWRTLCFALVTFGYWLLSNGLRRTLAKSWAHLMHREIFIAMASGALAISLGGFFYVRALQLIPATVATPIGAANPLLATVAAMFLFGEKLRPVQWAGVCVVIVGTVVVAM